MSLGLHRCTSFGQYMVQRGGPLPSLVWLTGMQPLLVQPVGCSDPSHLEVRLSQYRVSLPENTGYPGSMASQESLDKATGIRIFIVLALFPGGLTLSYKTKPQTFALLSQYLWL